MSCENPIIDVSTAIGPRTRILLGVWDTLNVRSQSFDLTAWVNAYGAGQVIILHQRPGDELPYQVQGVTFENGVATWTFNETDTAIVGQGEAAVFYMVGEDYIARTVPIVTYVRETIGMSGPDVPDPWESWYTNVLEASASAAQSAEDAAASASDAAGYAHDADESAGAAATSESNAATSERNAASSAAAAHASELAAAASAADAQTALEGMVYVTFGIDADGHVIIRNGDLLGTTSFELIAVTGTPAGHLEVTY